MWNEIYIGPLSSTHSAPFIIDVKESEWTDPISVSRLGGPFIYLFALQVAGTKNP